MEIWKPLLTGQVLSILLAASGAANDTLHFQCNLNAPSLQAGLIYFLLIPISGNIILERRRMIRENERANTSVELQQSNSGQLNQVDDLDDDLPMTNTSAGICCRRSNSCSSIFPIEGSLKMYFFMGLLDVEGNYLTYLAFRYTTLTSVSLLDALAIPSAMVFSRLMLRRCYRPTHFIGAIICIIGVFVNVYCDFKGDQNENENNVDQNDENNEGNFHQIRGDVYASLGAIMYGLSDTLTERCVKHIGGVREYQAMTGLFGSIVALVQGLLLDRDAVTDFFNRDDEDCSTSKALSILMISALFGVASYIGISNFLVESEAAFLNLSLLTADFWAVFFSIVVQRIIPLPLFWLALFLIVVGVLVYELSGSPIVDDREDGYDEGVGDFDHFDNFRSNGLIRQRDEDLTSHHLRELEMPDDEII